MMTVQESFSAKPMAASGGLLGAAGGSLGGFLCTVGGTIKLTYTDAGGATVLDTLTVVASTFYPLPFAFDRAVYVTMAGGAAGTFAIG